MRTCASLLALLALPGSGRGADRQQPPNVLFILTDDQRFDALGAYGNRVVRTPNLDRLAAQGARLDAFYVASPLCNPSRASFLTGLYPHQHGVLGGAKDRRPQSPEDIPAGSATVATLLNRVGYRTGFIGKAHLAGDPRRWGFTETPVFLSEGASEHVDPQLNVGGAIRKVRGQITQIFADAAISFVRHKTDKPWFLWFSTTAPHEPYFDPTHSYRASQITPPPGWPPGQPLESPQTWAEYYATISMLDDQIGRVLAEIDRLGMAERTVVIFASDNGFMFGSHGQAKKQVWFEESVRTPAIVRWPGHIQPGTVVVDPVVSVDLLPTLLDLSGSSPIAALEGTSMLPALQARPSLRKVAYSEVQQGKHWGGDYWQMVRDSRFKLVRFKDGREYFYDLSVDPWERADPMGVRGQRAAKDHLRRALDEWLLRTPQPRVRAPGKRVP